VKPEPVKIEEPKAEPIAPVVVETKTEQPVAVIETPSGEPQAFELPVPKKPRGRERKHESNADRQRAYRERKRGRVA
jgi:hypothetical protein